LHYPIESPLVLHDVHVSGPRVYCNTLDRRIPSSQVSRIETVANLLWPFLWSLVSYDCLVRRSSKAIPAFGTHARAALVRSTILTSPGG
jgi:hypothetical protein